jgi:hypothetical protein
MLVLLANPMPGHRGYHAGPTSSGSKPTIRRHPAHRARRSDRDLPDGATRRTQHHTAAETFYAVVVGGGISGSIIADELSRAAARPRPSRTARTTARLARRVQRSAPSASGQPVPYPVNPNAPRPRKAVARRSGRASRTPAATRSRTTHGHRHHPHPALAAPFMHWKQDPADASRRTSTSAPAGGSGDSAGQLRRADAVLARRPSGSSACPRRSNTDARAPTEPGWLPDDELLSYPTRWWQGRVDGTLRRRGW